VLPSDTWADWLDASHDNPLSLIPQASVPGAYKVEYASGPQPGAVKRRIGWLRDFQPVDDADDLSPHAGAINVALV
jgi:hypothetical protein